ncbi:hypothetical protein EDB89DRAFT_1921516 [Lactarius sanguifluus]|nr:hypothetical protein EDB89DRAFT_1921516 [Lactarius sanguifluus]
MPYARPVVRRDKFVEWLFSALRELYLHVVVPRYTCLRSPPPRFPITALATWIVVLFAYLFSIVVVYWNARLHRLFRRDHAWRRCDAS